MKFEYTVRNVPVPDRNKEFAEVAEFAGKRNMRDMRNWRVWVAGEDLARLLATPEHLSKSSICRGPGFHGVTEYDGITVYSGMLQSLSSRLDCKGKRDIQTEVHGHYGLAYILLVGM